MNNAEWYVDWFNSPYYHLLYNNRTPDEANFFIDNLCAGLDLQPPARLWDNACGKGRHAIAFNKKGFHVTGTDLSRNSIREALLSSNASLDFYVHDMREPFRVNYFDAVLNLFTSIGYFKNFNDNFMVFKNVSQALKPNGYFVIDFFNSEKIGDHLNASYVETRGSIDFHIRKKIAGKTILKCIDFVHNQKEYHFEENVSLLKKADFEDFAGKAGLRPHRVFGSYQLDAFDPQSSERLILVFKK